MNILTIDNTSYEINGLPESIDDLRFCILDNSNPDDPDYFFIPLIFLENYNSPALVLKIGPYRIQMPVDWQLLIGEKEFGDLEAIPLSSLNDRGFSAFVFNSISDYSPDFLPVELLDVYPDVRWYFPKLRVGQYLCVPLSEGPNPVCAYFIKDVNRQSEVLDIRKAW